MVALTMYDMGIWAIANNVSQGECFDEPSLWPHISGWHQVVLDHGVVKVMGDRAMMMVIYYTHNNRPICYDVTLLL